MKFLRKLRGYLWFWAKFGLRRLVQYERCRRSGMTIDYAKVFTDDERAQLGEHIVPAPWEMLHKP